MPRKKKLLVLIACGLLIAIGISTFMFTQSKNRPQQISESINRQVLFTAYTPKESSGFKLKPGSETYDDGVLLYTIEIPNGKKLLMSQQAISNDFNVDDFNQTISEPVATTTPNGRLIAGTMNNSKVASIVINSVWVFISGAEETNETQFVEIVESLKPL